MANEDIALLKCMGMMQNQGDFFDQNEP